MVFVKNVKYCEAEYGEHILDFAKQIVAYAKEVPCDVIGRFGFIYIPVTKEMTEKDVIDYYHQAL